MSVPRSVTTQLVPLCSHFAGRRGMPPGPLHSPAMIMSLLMARAIELPLPMNNDGSGLMPCVSGGASCGDQTNGIWYGVADQPTIRPLSLMSSARLSQPYGEQLALGIAPVSDMAPCDQRNP